MKNEFRCEQASLCVAAIRCVTLLCPSRYPELSNCSYAS